MHLTSAFFFERRQSVAVFILFFTEISFFLFLVAFVLLRNYTFQILSFSLLCCLLFELHLASSYRVLKSLILLFFYFYLEITCKILEFYYSWSQAESGNFKNYFFCKFQLFKSKIENQQQQQLPRW